MGSNPVAVTVVLVAKLLSCTLVSFVKPIEPVVSAALVLIVYVPLTPPQLIVTILLLLNVAAVPLAATTMLPLPLVVTIFLP